MCYSFLIGQLFLKSFVGQVQVTSPLCLSKNIRSGAYNEIEFPQFRFNFEKFVPTLKMQFKDWHYI
ncbi:hypothetical protein AHAS_Ahas12G0211900 [Arachis hypogaea]